MPILEQPTITAGAAKQYQEMHGVTMPILVQPTITAGATKQDQEMERVTMPIIGQPTITAGAAKHRITNEAEGLPPLKVFGNHIN